MSYVKPAVYFISQSLLNLRNSSNPDTDDLESLVKQFMPSGSGIDCGTKLDIEKSTPTKLVFTFDYHHMNEHGYYCGWTSHKLIVTPTFDDFDMQIIGQHPSKTKHQTDWFHAYLYDTFRHALSSRFEYSVDTERKERVYTYKEVPERNWQVRIPAHWLRNNEVTA